VDYRPEIYTQQGLDWIDNTTFTRVLVRHMPELSTKLAKVENGFFPWDEENEWYEIKARK
jgi:hypothetical protein